MNKAMKIAIVVALIVVVGIVIAIKQQGKNAVSEPAVAVSSNTNTTTEDAPRNTENTPNTERSANLPRLVDLGADKCIPCKMMAPILENLRKEYHGRLEVIFIDVWKNPDEARNYNIRYIPTQVFYDPSDKERFRHEGFFSKEDILAKWKELGYDFLAKQKEAFSRLEPPAPDKRPKEKLCYMCDGDINPKTLVTVRTEKGPVLLCGPHCYFIMYSCLTQDKTDFEKNVSVTDWARAEPVAADQAVYLYTLDGKTGRPAIKPFADKATAQAQQAESGGSIIAWPVLKEKELTVRCGFCDRACYPQNAAAVIAGGIRTWGCCSHCAMGVAARTGLDIEVRERDRLTGEPIVVKTVNGSVASIEPPSAVAWFGQRKKPDGTWASAGCFHQGFFVNAENLKKWVRQNPYETGTLISIHQALADKMKLSPEQIKKACKIGECAPK